MLEVLHVEPATVNIIPRFCLRRERAHEHVCLLLAQGFGMMDFPRGNGMRVP